VLLLVCGVVAAWLESRSRPFRTNDEHRLLVAAALTVVPTLAFAFVSEIRVFLPMFTIVTLACSRAIGRHLTVR
jgi:hypothetical protein